MKYTIEGFQQKALIEFELDCTDAVILRYLYDFYYSGNMITSLEMDKKEYYWIHYKKILDDLPILGVNKRAIERRFRKYKDKGLMKTKVKRGIDEYKENGEKKSRIGTYLYFGFNEDIFERLLSVPEDDNDESYNSESAF